MANLSQILEISEMIYKGKVEEAKILIPQVEDEDYRDILWGAYYGAIGNFDARRDFALKVINKEEIDPVKYIWALEAVIWSYFRQGDYMIAKGFANTALEIYNRNFEEINARLPFINGSIHNTLGSLALEQGYLDDAVEYFRRALEIRLSQNDSIVAGSSQNNLAMALQKQGKIDEALNLYMQALQSYEGTAPDTMIARVKSNIAEIYRFRSNFDKALAYHKEVLNIRIKSNHDYDMALSYYYVGKTLMEMLRAEESLKYFETSDMLWTKVGNLQWLSANLLSWGKSLLQLDRSADLIMQRLAKAQELDDNQLIDQRYRLFSAMMLKNVKRMTSLAKSQDILEDIIDEPMIDFEILYDALLHSCDILFIEIKITADPRIYEEARNRIYALERLTKDNGAYGKMIEILFLKSKMAIVDLEYEKAHAIISQADLIAYEKNLTYYFPAIKKIQDELDRDIIRVKEILEKNEEVIERVKVVELTDYLTSAQRIKSEIDDSKNGT